MYSLSVTLSYRYMWLYYMYRNRDISGYNIHAYTYTDSYEAIVQLLSDPEQFVLVVRQQLLCVQKTV